MERVDWKHVVNKIFNTIQSNGGADTVITYVSASIQQADLFNLKPLAQLFDFFQTGLGVFPMHIVQRGNQSIH